MAAPKFQTQRRPPRTASPVVAQLFDTMRARRLPISVVAKYDMGMTRVGLQYWKSGRATPPITQVEALAQSLGYRLVLEEIEK